MADTTLELKVEGKASVLNERGGIIRAPRLDAALGVVDEEFELNTGGRLGARVGIGVLAGI